MSMRGKTYTPLIFVLIDYLRFERKKMKITHWIILIVLIFAVAISLFY